MRSRTLSLIVVFAAMGVLVLALTVRGLAAGELARGDELLVSNLAPEPEKQASWTPERMRAAKPYPLPSIEGGRGPCQAEAGSRGPAGLAPGGAEGQEYSLDAIKAGIQYFPEGAGDGASPGDYPYPPPYTRYEAIPMYMKIWPHWTIGKLYFTQGGYDYYCTASSVGGYAVWTAGHCVSDGFGAWSENFLFVGAEMDGNPGIPWAVWEEWYSTWTHPAWHKRGEWCRDSGGVVFWPNAAGRRVSHLGWLGFAWNWDPDQHWHQIGYPGELPFDGNRQIVCASSRSSAGDCLFPESPQTMGAGCDQTGGCSGGPWILEYTPWYRGSGNVLNGNTSYGSDEEKFSPYFDDLSYDLWEALVRVVPRP